MTQENVSVAAAPGKMPSVMRYDRVQAILDSDPALKPFLGPKDQEVIKRNGEKHRYNRGVVNVTNALHERGFDAHNTDKYVVLALAYDILRDKPQKPAAEKPKVEKPKVEKPKVEKPKVEKPPKVKAAPKPKAEAQPKPAKPAKPSSVPEKPEPSKPEKATAALAPAQAPAPTGAALSHAAPVPSSDKPAYVYYIYGTALSHAVTIYKTLEIGDRMPGAEARLETVSRLIDQLKPLANTGVPMPEDFNNALKNAKANSGS